MLTVGALKARNYEVWLKLESGISALNGLLAACGGHFAMDCDSPQLAPITDESTVRRLLSLRPEDEVNASKDEERIGDAEGRVPAADMPYLALRHVIDTQFKPLVQFCEGLQPWESMRRKELLSFPPGFINAVRWTLPVGILGPNFGARLLLLRDSAQEWLPDNKTRLMSAPLMKVLLLHYGLPIFLVSQAALRLEAELEPAKLMPPARCTTLHSALYPRRVLRIPPKFREECSLLSTPQIRQLADSLALMSRIVMENPPPAESPLSPFAEAVLGKDSPSYGLLALLNDVLVGDLPHVETLVAQLAFERDEDYFYNEYESKFSRTRFCKGPCIFFIDARKGLEEMVRSLVSAEELYGCISLTSSTITLLAELASNTTIAPEMPLTAAVAAVLMEEHPLISAHFPACCNAHIPHVMAELRHCNCLATMKWIDSECGQGDEEPAATDL